MHVLNRIIAGCAVYMADALQRRPHVRARRVLEYHR